MSKKLSRAKVADSRLYMNPRKNAAVFWIAQTAFTRYAKNINDDFYFMLGVSAQNPPVDHRHSMRNLYEAK